MYVMILQWYYCVTGQKAQFMNSINKHTLGILIITFFLLFVLLLTFL